MKAMELDYDMALNAALLMEREGGSFAGHIARAFYVADTTNRTLLLTAFDDLFVRYYKLHRRDQFNQGETA